MLTALRERLVPPDEPERHAIMASLLGRPRDVVDLGGVRGRLAPWLPDTAVTAVNAFEDADVRIPPGPVRLPFDDAAFEASCSLDTLEHIPRSDRGHFVSELLRVAERLTVLCCPLGTPLREQVETADNAWYEQRTGAPHPWISEHLEHRPPTVDELRELFARDGTEIEMRFHGDVRETSHQFRLAEASVLSRRPGDMLRWLAFRMPYRQDLELSDTPSPWSNRVFVIARRRV